MSPPAEIAGRYAIERRLGAGGMSTVFLATDTVLERPVAVKLLAEHLADDEAFVARFRREALAAARLQHPNIVQVFDSGQDPESRPPLHRHGVRGRSVRARTCCASTSSSRSSETVRVVARRLPRARLRPPRRGRPPRRQARQPAGRRGDAHHEARRLRHREGRRADAHHPGRARCSAPPPTSRPSRPAARRPARVGHLLARRLRLPVPHRPAAARVRVAHRARAQAAAGPGRRRSREFRPEVPPELDAADPPLPRARPGRALRSALEMAQALEAGLHGETTDATRRRSRADDRRHARARRHRGHPRDAARRPSAARRRPSARRPRPARGRRADREAAPGGAPAPPGHLPGAAARAGGDRRGGGRAARLERRRRRCEAPDADNVQQQIQELRHFIQENTR